MPVMNVPFEPVSEDHYHARLVEHQELLDTVNSVVHKQFGFGLDGLLSDVQHIECIDPAYRTLYARRILRVRRELEGIFHQDQERIQLNQLQGASAEYLSQLATLQNSLDPEAQNDAA